MVRRTLRKLAPLFALATIVFAITAVRLNWLERLAAWYNAEDLPHLRAQLCGSLQKKYDAWKKANSGTPAVEAAERRLWCMDNLTSNLAQNIDNTNNIGGHGMPRSRGADLIAEYAPQLALDARIAILPPVQRDLVERYYLAYAQASEEFILKHGRLVAASGSPTPTLAEWCFVLPLLDHSEDQWANYAIPDWLQKAGCRQMMEYLALRSGHPRAAFACSENGRNERQSSSFAHYIAVSVTSLLKAKQYLAAEACAQAGIANAKGPEDSVDYCSLVGELAEALSKMGKKADALHEVTMALEENQDPSKYGQLLLLHLRCLYENDRCDEVLEIARRNRDDKRCDAVRPQILYLGWVAARHLDSKISQESAVWRQEFLDCFPEHMLGADMRFATAMELLAAGDYEHASQQLAIIEEHYPTATIAAKARDIRKRLQSTTQ